MFQLRRFTIAVLACACTASTTAIQAAPERADASPRVHARALTAWSLRPRINAFQHERWYWERLIGLRHAAPAGGNLKRMTYEDGLAALRLWRRRALAARRRGEHPPHFRQFLCIHRYEGSWTDGGPPYYGGLQMDLGFQRSYGGFLLRLRGTADHWRPLEQIWIAERAFRSGRGFWPWPNTARACGLL